MQGAKSIRPTPSGAVCRLGDDVYDRDGARLGTVMAVTPETRVVTVERASGERQLLYVPSCFVQSSQLGRVQLDVSDDEAINAGWDRPPERQPRAHPLRCCSPLWSDHW